MIEWLKYFPAELRDCDEPCTPKGSSFNHARSVKVNIMGCQLQFRAPRHRPDIRSIRSRKPGVSNITFSQRRRFNSDGPDADFWLYRPFFFRGWGFWGPWFSGSKAQLSMSASIIGRAEEAEYQGVSFFHPRVFENVLVDYLNFKYGHDKHGTGRARYRGPLNWQTRQLLPVISATADVCHEHCGKTVGIREQLMLFPISEKIFVEVVFTHFIATNKDKNQQPIINPKYLNELAEGIINSFTLELSPEIQAQWDAVKAQSPDMSLCKTFAPLKWPVSNAQEETKSRANNLRISE